MPDGVIKWYDNEAGLAEVVRGGRVYHAQLGAVEPAARRAGAHVQFDIERVDGVEQAVNVRLRVGTRVSHRQHRFGTLVGARQSDMKGASLHATVHPELREPEIHPLEVARSWATSLARGDVAAALALCSPETVLHEGDRRLSGRSSLQAWFEANPLLGSGRPALIRGGNGDALVLWEPVGPDEVGVLVRCRVTHGEIEELWVTEPDGAATEATEPEPGTITLSVVTKGDVGGNDEASAVRAVLAVVDRIREPVLFARLKLTHEPDRARSRPSLAQALLDVDGDLVRAQVAARSVPEATDALVRRLHDRLEHRLRKRAYLRGSTGVAEPGEWRHGDLATIRPPYFDRPVEDRQILRQKTFAVGELTPDEAAFDLEQLDYDFYLFRDLASGSDALMERVGDGSYRLTQTVPAEIDPASSAVALEVSSTGAPSLSIDEAIERLNVGAEPHVFFVDASSGRGIVLYRRYDGHYGLIGSE